jgi:peptide/nickel transport system substrate-binding protein
MKIAGQMFYNQLSEVDEHGRLVPVLAESWDVKPGAADWVFKIRRGPTFHNGKELTAADVVYSINHHRGKDSKSAAKALLSPIKDLTATGPNEMRVLLSSGDLDLPYVFANAHLVIGLEGTKFDDGIGTGSYIYDSYKPGVVVNCHRNANSWRPDRGFVDSMEILGVDDPTARLNGVESGSLHLINGVEPRIASKLKMDSRVNLYSISGGGHETFPMRCDLAPFKDPNLRLAMKFAIDRESILRRVLNGYGKLGNDNPIPSYDPMYAADIPQRQCDPDKARFYYKKAGYDGPVILSVSEAAFTGAVDTAQLFQASAKQAGIDIQLDRQPESGYWDNVWMKKPFCASSWLGKPTADLLLSYIYKSDAPWNESYWKRPDFDPLLIAARAEGNEIKRKQMYHDLQMMIYEDGGSVIPIFNNYLNAGSKRLRGFVPNPAQDFANFRAPEIVWFAS